MAKEKNPVQTEVEKACKKEGVRIKKMEDKRRWFWERNGFLTGTDMAGLLGLSPWISAGEVLRKKQQGLTFEVPPTESMEWGIRHESTILQAYEEKTRNKVWRPEPYTLFVQKGDIPADLIGWADEGDEDGNCVPAREFKPDEINALSIFAGTPDAFGLAEGIGHYGIEIKTSSTSDGWKTPPEDSDGMLAYADNESIPVHYYVQVQTYMTVMPFIPHFDVVVLLAGNKMRTYHIKRDEDMISTIRNYGFQMYSQYLWMLEGIPSVLFEKNPDDCVKAWPNSRRDYSLSLDNSDRAVIASEAYFYVNKYISFLEKLKTNLRGIVVAQMKEAEAISNDNVKVSYKSGTFGPGKANYQKKFDLVISYLQRVHPNIHRELINYIQANIGAYMEMVPPTRRFLVTVPKDKQKTISAEVINGQLQKLGESHMGHAVPAIGIDEAEV